MGRGTSSIDSEGEEEVMRSRRTARQSIKRALRADASDASSSCASSSDDESGSEKHAGSASTKDVTASDASWSSDDETGSDGDDGSGKEPAQKGRASGARKQVACGTAGETASF